MHKKTFIILAAAIVVFGAIFWAISGHRGANAPGPHFERSTFVIVRADGKRLPFKADVAKSEEEKTHGLMFRRSLPKDEGMIFLYPSPEEAVFWMKDTFIPLDMLFVRSGGTIGRVVAEAKPMDLTPVYSKEPVIAVIEINGGVVRKMGIKAGDKIESPVLQKNTPPK